MASTLGTHPPVTTHSVAQGLLHELGALESLMGDPVFNDWFRRLQTSLRALSEQLEAGLDALAAEHAPSRLTLTRGLHADLEQTLHEVWELEGVVKRVETSLIPTARGLLKDLRGVVSEEFELASAAAADR